MGFLSYRKPVKLGQGTQLNISKSGVSASKKIGKRITVNSSGRITVRIAPGLVWKSK